MENNIEYDNNNFSQIRKTVVNYTVVIFGLIFIMIFILLGLYYLTPNNYSIFKWIDVSGKLKLIKTVEYIIKPYSNLFVNFQTIETIETNKTNIYLKFSEKTNLMVKNNFKSQIVEIDTEQLVLVDTYGSEIYIINNSNTEKKITVQFYSVI